MPIPWPNKDPDDIMDYGVDLSALLGDPLDTIASTSATIVSGNVVIEQHDPVPGTQATVTWLSGGTVGTQSSIRIRTTTSKGRSVDVVAVVAIADRT